MERVHVSSSNIRSIGYDAEAQVLEIEFISSGVYQYSDVPEQVHERLMSARSKGSFFSANIRDRFQTRKIR